MRRFDCTATRVITLMGRFSVQVKPDEDAEEVALAHMVKHPQTIEWSAIQGAHGSAAELVELQEYTPYPWEPIIHALHAHHRAAQPVQPTS